MAFRTHSCYTIRAPVALPTLLGALIILKRVRAPMTATPLKAMALEAQAKGLKTFDPGYPCDNGHYANRQSSRVFRCVQCIRLDNDANNKKRRDVNAERFRIEREANPHYSKIISREDAKGLGLTMFFTGVVCKQGHLSDRRVSSGLCYECTMIRSAKDNAIKKEKRIASVKEAIIPYQDKIVSKEFAIESGLKRYFTGKPCKVNKHVCERYVANGLCIDCTRQSSRKRHAPRRVIQIADDGTLVGKPCKKCGDTRRNKFKKCPTCLLNMRKARRPRLNEEKKARRRERPEWQAEQDRRQYIREKAMQSVYKAKRAKHEIVAKLPWITREERDAIRLFRKNTPKGCQVDHIVPLLGENVCGLNMLVNLQYLTKKENMDKRNHFPWCDRSARPAWFDDKI